MAFSLKNIIFGKFGKRDAINDVLKDPISNKGFKQRFQELLAWDSDDNEIDLINNLVENTQAPRTVLTKFLPYNEGRFGGLVDLHGSLLLRRKVLEHASYLHRIRSTKKGYETLFRWMGFDTYVVMAAALVYGFDSPTTFDDDDRVFDGHCATCRKYSIELTGTMPITSELVNGILNVVTFNEPIDMELMFIYYNGTPIINGFAVQFFIDGNGDLIYVNPYDPSFSAELIDGDLVITSDFAQFYEIDINGDIIFTTN